MRESVDEVGFVCILVGRSAGARVSVALSRVRPGSPVFLNWFLRNRYPVGISYRPRTGTGSVATRGRAGVSLGWMVLRFVCVIRVPVCARVSRVCVPCVSRLPPVTFYRYVSKLFRAT